MSLPKEPAPAKMIAGFLFRSFDVRPRVFEILSDKFGPMDFISEPSPFTFTRYYNREMGPDIYRQTLGFLNLIRPESLPDVKSFTNALEMEFSVAGKRRVNIDPGILSEERVVLATGKNYTHRIYLRDGIYADLTLIYTKGLYQALPWTYPSYRDPQLLHFLGILRRKLIFQRTNALPRKGIH